MLLCCGYSRDVDDKIVHSLRGMENNIGSATNVYACPNTNNGSVEKSKWSI